MDTSKRKSNQETQNDQHIVSYQDCFVPYRVERDDGDAPHDYEIRWAFFDPKSDKNKNGTKEFYDEIRHDIKRTGRHISEEQLRIHAKEYGARQLFTSEDPEAVPKLQAFLNNAALRHAPNKKSGRTIDVEGFLAEYGFAGDTVHGFNVSKTALPSTESEEPKKHNEIKSEHEITSKNESNIEQPDNDDADNKSAGSVPINVTEYWDKNDARTLLIDAMTFTAKEIDQSKKAIFKETASNVPTFGTTAVNPTGIGLTGSGLGVGTISGLFVQKTSGAKDLDKMKSIWSKLQNNINNPTISPDEAHEILKNDMHKSGLLFEGAEKLDHDLRRKYIKFINNQCELEGRLKTFTTLKAKDVEKAGKSIRNMSANAVIFVNEKAKTAARKTSLYAGRQKHNLGVYTEAIKEMFTDLNVLDRNKHKKFDKTLWKAAKISVKDGKDFLSSTFSKCDNSSIIPCFCPKKGAPTISEDGMKKVKKMMPSTITSYIDIDDALEKVSIIEDKEERSSGKLSANANFIVTSGSMALQIGLSAISLANQEFGNAAVLLMGLAFGYGAYGQTAKDVVKVDAKINSERAEKAVLSDYIIQIEERLEENAKAQHVPIPETHNDTKTLDL